MYLLRLCSEKRLQYVKRQEIDRLDHLIKEMFQCASNYSSTEIHRDHLGILYDLAKKYPLECIKMYSTGYHQSWVSSDSSQIWNFLTWIIKNCHYAHHPETIDILISCIPHNNIKFTDLNENENLIIHRRITLRTWEIEQLIFSYQNIDSYWKIIWRLLWQCCDDFTEFSSEKSLNFILKKLPHLEDNNAKFGIYCWIFIRRRVSPWYKTPISDTLRRKIIKIGMNTPELCSDIKTIQFMLESKYIF